MRGWINLSICVNFKIYILYYVVVDVEVVAVAADVEAGLEGRSTVSINEF